MPAKKPEPTGFSISPAMIKWLLGTLIALFTAIVLWWQVFDRVDAHWRLEAIQKAKDDKIDADIKGVAAKADTDLKGAITKIENDFAKYKEADRRAGAWTLYIVQDFRAAAEAKWAQDCVDRKRPADICRELDAKASEARARANEQRAAAMDSSKEKP